MSHGDHQNPQFIVNDDVDNPVGTRSNPPLTAAADKLSSRGRPRVFGEEFDKRLYSASRRRVEFSQLSYSARRKRDRVGHFSVNRIALAVEV